MFSKRLKVTGAPPPCEGARRAAQLHYAIRVQTPDAYAPTMDGDGKIKAPPSAGRMWLAGLQIFGIWYTPPAGAYARNANDSNTPSAIQGIREGAQGRDLTGR